MFRTMLCSMLLAGLCATLAPAAEKTKADKHKKGHEAEIVKVDPQNGTLTVKMTNKKGNEVEKTFKLAEDIEYADSTGQVATIDIFTSGDMVLFVDHEGQIKKLTNKDKPAKKTDDK
ncbi:MAG TPA: hypothetical protein VIK18_13515 [Pirellulales bacterium]